LKPFVKKYSNDEELKKDVRSLAEKGVKKEDIYVISHDDDRTKRVAGGADANTIGLKEEDFGSAVGNLFNKKGDELRNKIHDIGFSKEDAAYLESELDEGKILLIVTNSDISL
jgi:hypothetical protein